MMHEEEKRLDWKEPALFLTSSLCFGTVWFSVLQLTMHLNEDQSQTTLMLVSAFCCVLGFAYYLPVTVVFGVACFSYFFSCPAIGRDWLDGSQDAAEECEEAKFPVWFTASACILCSISVPFLWRSLNYDWGEVLKQPKLHVFVIVESHIALYSLVFSTSLVFAVSFALCSVQEFCKKFLVTAEVSSVSDISTQGVEGFWQNLEWCLGKVTRQALETSLAN